MNDASLARRADPIVAIATAPGRGAVGIVRVSGRDLSALIAAVCGRTLAPRQATLLPFLGADGQALDRGLALHFPAPHSYTGEDVLELQAHGGPVLLQLLLARCLQALTGARLAQPGEFTERAFLNDKLDLAQAEAVADLIDASTEAAARSAARAVEGDFSRRVDALAQRLVTLRTLVEATLDFPEEEIDFLEQADARGQLRAIDAALRAVLAATRQGALLREGLRVVIAGQPNVGKSSLLNALAGAELAIVTPIPGTTRDRVSESIQVEGVPLHITDTAGLRRDDQAADEVERIGIGRSWGAIAGADCVLFVHDLQRARRDAAYDAAERGWRRVVWIVGRQIRPRRSVRAAPYGIPDGPCAGSGELGCRRPGCVGSCAHRRAPVRPHRRWPASPARRAAASGRLARRARGPVHRPRAPCARAAAHRQPPGRGSRPPGQPRPRAGPAG
jgi:tRNA modification GTPase